MFALDDAAQAFGAALNGKRLGRWGDAAALSFYPTKTLGCYGDGGAILTNDADRAELYRSLRTHGEGKTRYEVERTGMNGRLDTIQAAILLCKLPLMEQELKNRARIAGWYAERLAKHVIVPKERAGAQSAWGLYTVILPDAGARDRVQETMKARGVPSAIYYPKPLHHQPAYAGAHAAGLPNGPSLGVSENLCARVLSLPMHPYLDEGQVTTISDALIAGL